MALPRFVIYKEQEFSCAHYLREYHGMCERIHGHNYRVRIYVGADELDSEGMVMDYHALKVTMQNVIQKYDHRLINDEPPFEEVNPTAEILAQYIAEQVAITVDNERRRVFECHVWETEHNCAIYRR